METDPEDVRYQAKLVKKNLNDIIGKWQTNFEKKLT